jgi:hypothetical protein
VLVAGFAGLVLHDLEHKGRINWALAGVRQAGGLYARDEEDARRPVVSIDLDEFLVDDSGREYRKGRASDDLLARLVWFDRLRELSLERTLVTDAGLAHLAGLKSLRRLNLRGSPITDAGLLHLARLPGLQEIDLRETRVTAAEVAALRQALPGATIIADVK